MNDFFYNQVNDTGSWEPLVFYWDSYGRQLLLLFLIYFLLRLRLESTTVFFLIYFYLDWDARQLVFSSLSIFNEIEMGDNYCFFLNLLLLRLRCGTTTVIFLVYFYLRWETTHVFFLINLFIEIEMGGNSCFLLSLFLLRLRWETTPVIFIIY